MKRTLLAAAAFFVTAIPSALGQQPPTLANARWVWDQADANSVAQTDDPRYLRRSFTLTQGPRGAWLWITSFRLSPSMKAIEK